MFDFLISLFIRLGTAAVLVGWLLSAIGELNGRGYLLAGVPAVLLIGMVSRRDLPAPHRRKFLRRAAGWWRGRRLLPLIFFLTFALVALGSVLYEPNNFDALSYRSPKVLHWLAAGRRNWIHAPYEPINYTMPNFEWLTVPLFLLTHGFHAPVILNWIAFLVLPSLFFSLLRAFGAPGRTAHDWMWLFPSGYLIVMLAGGIGNDLPGLAVMLAALHCANRFAATGKAAWLFDALLAAGFCTAIKLSSIPLPVFVGIILLRGLRRLRGHPLALVSGTVLGALASALIPLLLNFKFSGSVFGVTGEQGQTQGMLAGVVGNSLIMLTTMLVPPVVPGADRISQFLENGLWGLPAWNHSHYGRFTLRLNELAQEETGGLGLGITVALLLMAALWWRARRAGKLTAARPQLPRWQRIAWWAWLGFAYLAVAAKLGTGDSFPRNLLPWFPLPLAPVIAFIGCEAAQRSKAWRTLAPLAALSVLPAVLLSPSRPLIPAEFILNLSRAAGAAAAAQDRIRKVYETYAVRADPFAPLRAELPPDARVIGLLTQGGEATSAWWKPYGSRRCV